MSKKVREQMVNHMNTKGCLEFPFNFLGDIAEKGTAEGAEIEKLAANNGIRLCSAGLQKKVLQGCKLGYGFNIFEKSNPALYNISADDDCDSNTKYVCGFSENDSTGACITYEPKAAGLGASCECIETVSN